MNRNTFSLHSKTADRNTIVQAANVLRNRGLVAFPTETVYGLGANAFDSYAVAKIFEVKNRPRFDPLIVHIRIHKDIKKVCSKVHKRAIPLIKKFWPGPLTILLPKSEKIPDIVTAGLPTVAVRIPSHTIAQDLLRETKFPIAAPSANPFGYLSPTTAKHVEEQLGQKVDFILDGGSCLFGIESTIIDFTSSDPTLLRPGGLPVEEIEKVVGDVKKLYRISSKPRSPGQLQSHYAPKTPIEILHSNKQRISKEKEIGLLAFSSSRKHSGFDMIEVLSPSGDLREAAANLFSCLHRLDKAGLDMIYAEPVDETGLGRAIMDRLRRASTNCVST
ncbi:MAG: L-threonylcarbamoyladenylate synthase [Candidatus Thermoplasmatota archaeon]|nr:L-threonylcarbamoyladenylate synthase [Candidatus Thermoplasmatota archaeon]